MVISSLSQGCLDLRGLIRQISIEDIITITISRRNLIISGKLKLFEMSELLFLYEVVFLNEWIVEKEYEKEQIKQFGFGMGFSFHKQYRYHQ